MCDQNHGIGGSHLYIEIAAGTMMEIKTLLWSPACTLVWKSRGCESVWWPHVTLYITKQSLVIWVFVWWLLLYADASFVLCFGLSAMTDYSSGRRRICVIVWELDLFAAVLQVSCTFTQLTRKVLSIRSDCPLYPFTFVQVDKCETDR